MRTAIRVMMAASVALTPVGVVQAAKSSHPAHRAYDAGSGQAPPGYARYGGNAAAEGNNANSMSGSNSAGENANGRTNCC